MDWQVFEQVNNKCPLQTQFYNFQPPTLTLSPQTSHPPNLTILFTSLSWSQDHFVYVTVDMGFGQCFDQSDD